jgi:transposase
VIRKEFGISYHPAHVSRLVRALGLSLQKTDASGEPARRGGNKALERGTLA